MFLAYFKVLKRRNFFFLWIGQIISQFGDRLTQMALIGLVYKIKPYSSLSLAKIMSLAVIPVFLVSPLAGVYVDRWNKQKTMYWSDLLRGLFIALIPAFFFYYHSLIIVYFLIFLSFCVGRFFIPSKMAIIPSLVDEKDIFMANSLVSTTAMVAAMFGFGIGGFIVEKYGIRIAFSIDAVTFFTSALLIFLMRIKERKRFNPHDLINLGRDAFKAVKHSLVHEIKDGLRYLLESKETKYATKVFFTLFSFIGSLYVVFVVFIQNTLSTITMELGVLAIGAGLGLFLGTLLYGRLGRSIDVKKVINLTLVSASFWLVLSVILLKYYPSELFAFFSVFLLGLIVSPVIVAVNSLIHKDSDSNLWGRIFSSLEVVIHLAFIIFMFIASFLAEIFRPFTIIVAVGIIIFLFSLYNLICDYDSSRRKKAAST